MGTCINKSLLYLLPDVTVVILDNKRLQNMTFNIAYPIALATPRWTEGATTDSVYYTSESPFTVSPNGLGNKGYYNLIFICVILDYNEL